MGSQGGISFSVTGAEEWRRLAQKIRGNKELQKALRSRIGKAARPIVGEVRSKALSLPSKNSDGNAMRERLAKGVRLSQTAKGVRFVADAKTFPNGRNMPRDVNKGVWRHPVFGNRSVWVNQRMPAEWFSGPLKKSTPRFRKAVLDAMDDTARKLGER